ncbi:hypothetical protein BV898_12730 [Hypsibius exemplaris]|uniref:Uncharacterized protein n=1 Tax=Hypsibius exemplaris TaxID=2072580 RepID=A0A1W0WD64_HYPEX|nr:hypothetical protein BV898_12730 [Hypsibius exemplaris]
MVITAAQVPPTVSTESDQPYIKTSAGLPPGMLRYTSIEHNNGLKLVESSNGDRRQQFLFANEVPLEQTGRPGVDAPPNGIFFGNIDWDTSDSIYSDSKNGPLPLGHLPRTPGEVQFRGCRGVAMLTYALPVYEADRTNEMPLTRKVDISLATELICACEEITYQSKKELEPVPLSRELVAATTYAYCVLAADAVGKECDCYYPEGRVPFIGMYSDSYRKLVHINNLTNPKT